MKKVILTLAVVAFAVVAAQAQSARVEVMMTDHTFGNKALARVEKPTQQKRAIAAKRSNLERQVARQVARAQAQAKAKKPVQKKARGKVKIAKREGLGGWLKAIFLGAPYPWENSNEYHDRLVLQSQPATMPFK